MIMLIFIILNTVLFITIIPTGSMSPVIKPYDIVVASCVPYFNAEPERGDIVIIKGDKINYCKRIVGLPNEELSLKEAMVYIDGEMLEEEYLEWKLTPAFGKELFQIPEEHYFVMGDLRWNSMDSRYWDEPYIA